jgi:hypothetical protein
VKLDQVGGDDCGKDDCPGVFVDHDDTEMIVVRGDEISVEEYTQIANTGTERVVRIPKHILLQAAAKVGASE